MSENLWSFAKRIYAEPEVAAQCLTWQEQFGADVDLLLAGLWRASRQQIWSENEVTELERHCAVWRESGVLPLRATRRALVRSDLYAMLKQAELAAERTQLGMIESWFNRHAPVVVDLPRAVCAERNLACYARLLGSAPDSVALRALTSCCVPLLVFTRG